MRTVGADPCVLYRTLVVGSASPSIKESSPFAVDGEELDDRFTSYHAFDGVEVGLTRWIGLAADVRYRSIPGVLGDGGVSNVLGDHSFNGASVSLRFVAGTRGRTARRAEVPHTPRPAEPVETGRKMPPPEKNVPPREEPKTDDESQKSPSGVRRGAVINITSGVYVLPNENRTPLRILEAGTRVTVIEEGEEWLKVEFRDPQWGPRVGYFLRRNAATDR